MDNEYTDRANRLKRIVLPLLQQITDTEINIDIDDNENVRLNGIAIGTCGMIKEPHIENDSTLVFDYGEESIREVIFDDPELENDGIIKTIFEYSKSNKAVKLIYDIYTNNS